MMMVVSFTLPPLLLLLLLILVSNAAAAYTNSVSGPRRHRRSGTTCFHSSSKTAAATTEGLLRGIDVASADSYTSELKMDSLEDVQWLLDPGVLWKAVVMDAKALNLSPDEHLQDVTKAMVEFCNSNKVHDCREANGVLEQLHAKRGNLLLVLGGKSAGKSLVLADFEEKLRSDADYMPLRVDGHTIDGSLSTGILKACKAERLNLTEGDTLNGLRALANSFRGPFTSGMQENLDGLQVLVDLLKRDKEFLSENINRLFDSAIELGKVSEAEAIQSFVDFAEQRGKHPVLIIDEGGLEDGGATGGSPDVNGDKSSILVAGEMPPKSMWELLVEKKARNKPLIGMGENLARLLIASYGGNFLRLLQALKSLNFEKEHFSARTSLNPISDDITCVLDSFPFEGLILLRQMAESGFARVRSSRDPAVEMIVRSSIGGVVDPYKSGMPEGRIRTDGFSRELVPTSESARNLIAIKVLFFERYLEQRATWESVPHPRKTAPKALQQTSSEAPAYSTMTISELKEVLRERGLPVMGKKDELIMRLEQDDSASRRKVGRATAPAESVSVRNPRTALQQTDKSLPPSISKKTKKNTMPLKPKKQKVAEEPPYATMTVPKLTKELRRRGLPTWGKKAELVERLELNDNAKVGQKGRAPATSKGVRNRREKPKPKKQTDTDKYSNMTVPMLTKELRERGLTISGRKAELIKRLELDDNASGKVATAPPATSKSTAALQQERTSNPAPMTTSKNTMKQRVGWPFSML